MVKQRIFLVDSEWSIAHARLPMAFSMLCPSPGCFEKVEIYPFHWLPRVLLFPIQKSSRFCVSLLGSLACSRDLHLSLNFCQQSLEASPMSLACWEHEVPAALLDVALVFALPPQFQKAWVFTSGYGL
jgi:hypothetical protein